jgi:hypothetical protein
MAVRASNNVRRGKRRQKPIDRWFGLFAAAVGILLYLLPKTPPVVIGCLLAIFLLLAHPVWNFWWIEKAICHRILAFALLVLMLWSWLCLVADAFTTFQCIEDYEL